MLAIVRSIRAKNPDRSHLMRNYWISAREYPEEASEVSQVSQAVRDLNPQMLDEGDIRRQLIFPILEAVVADEIDEGRFRTNTAERIEWLAGNGETQELHIQLANLLLGSQFRLGGVEIRPIPNTGDLTEYNLKYEGPLGYGGPVDAVISYAVVAQAAGLGVRAWRNAIEMVERVLLLIRAIGLPELWGRQWLQAGIAGRGVATGWVILRQRVGPWNMSLGSGGPGEFMRLENMIRNWSSQEVQTLDRIYVKQNRTKMENKLLQAMFWLGEATFPASNDSRFSKLAIAFETAVGGDAKSRQLKEIGVREMLAERTAFVLGVGPKARHLIHRAVSGLYGIRSDLFHGEANRVTDGELSNWALLVWATVRSMVNRCEQFKTVEQFATWVRQQRYSLPDDV